MSRLKGNHGRWCNCNLNPHGGGEVMASVVAYSLCSGTLVLLNKLALQFFPYPSLLVCLQLVFTLAFIAVAKLLHWLPVDPIRLAYVLPYLLYIVLFSGGVYCNMKSLSMSNVETIIVFRALSPCVVAFLEAAWLGREYPSTRSWASLGLIALGAFGYTRFDPQFQILHKRALNTPTSPLWLAVYGWPLLYVLMISLEMTYGKRILQTVDLKTRTGPVLYTNLLALAPMLLLAVVDGELYQLLVVHHHNNQTNNNDSHSHKTFSQAAAFLILLLGCVVGAGIGYSGWWCRDQVSATSFTLIGVLNKCLTLLLNVLMWDQHAPPLGILSLLLCLVGGTLYQQAPVRKSILHNNPLLHPSQNNQPHDANGGGLAKAEDEDDIAEKSSLLLSTMYDRHRHDEEEEEEEEEDASIETGMSSKVENKRVE